MNAWSYKFAGSLIGIAVGDALGLPREGLTPRRAERLFGPAPFEHRLVFRRGMISDDTEHACMTAQALLASDGVPEAFARSLAWRLRGWLLGIPAGIGLATLRSILKLWIGFGPMNSGVFSAGNGPAMRAPIIGIWAAAKGLSPEATSALVRASTRLTHTDPRAFEGAYAIAMAACCGASACGSRLDPGAILARIQSDLSGDELRASLQLATDHLAQDKSTQEFVSAMHLTRGVTGYINNTVPVALYCWLRWPRDFRRAVEDAIAAGGDTDTTAAIVGSLAGATLGINAIPSNWLMGLCEWPRSARWMRALADRLATAGSNAGPLRLAWPGLMLRNPVFMTIVLLHGFRRLLPPY